MQTKYTIRATDGRYLAPITIEEAEELERSGIIRPDGEGGYMMVADSAFAVSQYVIYDCQRLCDDLFEEGPVVIERTASR
ncbi:MAG: hypothetical protein ACK5SY_00540 [bacterium]|jgi:hypothetical protein